MTNSLFRKIKRMTNRISINGRVFSGQNVNIAGGHVYINGVRQDGDKLEGVVEVRILEGSVENLQSDASITCGNVGGNVHAGGSVQCDNVKGSINAGGSVQADDVRGSINAGGSVMHG
jgi:hypothetical protein